MFKRPNFRRRRISNYMIFALAFIILGALHEAWPLIRDWADPYLPPAYVESDAAGEVFKTQSFTLAVSWQPAFCETASQRRECRTQNASRYDASNLSLHGLWPQRTFCGPRKSSKLRDWRNTTKRLKISSDTWSRLQILMPGTRSGLHHHEWVKHGTCYSNTPQTYYAHSIKILSELNDSLLSELFSSNKGRFLSARDIRAAFNRQYGKGTGDRVEIKCTGDGGRNLIQELRINMRGNADKLNVATLLRQARGRKQGCKGGIVDPVGLQ